MDIYGQIHEMQRLEELAGGNTLVHRLAPAAKLLATFAYLICVMSLERHSVTRLAPFLFYPVLMCAVGEIPPGLLLRRVMPALPFAFFAGLGNLFFERGAAGAAGLAGAAEAAGAAGLAGAAEAAGAATLAGTVSAAGLLSFAMILGRTFLCVAAVMILIAVTPFTDLMDALRRMHVPSVIADLLEMLYRYLSVLFEEAELMLTAFRLRSGGRMLPEISEYAPLISQLFLRSADRAERIYDAMKCRLYGAGREGTAGTAAGAAGDTPGGAARSPAKWNRNDLLFFLTVCASSVFFAMADVPALLGGLVL